MGKESGNKFEDTKLVLPSLGNNDYPLLAKGRKREREAM